MLSLATILTYKVALVRVAQAGGYLVPGTRAYRKVGPVNVPVPTMGVQARATLREFQRRAHLPVTGVLDAATREALIPSDPNVVATKFVAANVGPKEQLGPNDGPWLRVQEDAVRDAWMHTGHQPYCAEVGGRIAYEHAGVDLHAEFPHLNAAYCPSYVQHIRDGVKSVSGKWKWLRVSLDALHYGDVLLFDWQGDGLADHFGHATGAARLGLVPTVEANTGPGAAGNQSDGDGIYSRSRPTSVVVCAGRLVRA